ncbi:uncharacterized protein LOC135334611 isoform X3 [Halichondria panicea]|uniref:uncharacterized protein LOC135334611 isoform X3 n=1 Tax=Halichondria panicea TaxID=6063 RepID=UPI00312BBE49
MALTVKDVLIHDVQVYNGAVHRVEDPSERFFVKILFEGDERQIAMNRSRVSTPMHYCDEELVFPLKESLQTSGTQSLKLDVYQRDIRAIDMFIGTLDISLGLLINNRYQSPPLSLKNESLEESTVSVTVEYDDPSSPAKEIHDGSLTLGEVRAALWGARYEWIDLGLALGIPHSTIQVIEMDHRTIIDRFTAMLREWLMISSNSTWSDLVKALRSPTVHRPIVAIRIEDKYIKSDVSSVQEKENTARSSMLQRARMEAALWGARAKWFELGLALNLSEETLEIFIMGIGVELWRARIGLFNGGRGGRPRKASLAHQKLQCDVTIIVTKVLWTQYAEDTTSHRDKCVVESVLNNATDKAPPSNCHEDVVSEKKKESVTFTTNHIRNHSSSICIGLTLILIGAILVFVSLLLLLAGDVELNPGPGLATVLTISDILEVYDKVRSASPNWFNLGLALKLSYTDLTNFRETYRGENDVCLREALARRLQSGDPLTWGGMCTALRNSMVARNDVAEAIEGSLKRVSERLERAQNSTTKTASVSSIESLDGAISEVVSISRSTAELEVDSMEMQIVFNKFVSQLCQSLEVRRIDKDSLVACLMGFNSLKKVFGKTNQCVFRNQRNKLRKCSTSAEVWKIIADYFSFFNYEMVDHITDSFGTAEDKEKMKLYKANFVEYVKRRIRPVTSSDSREDTVTMIVQLDSTYDDCELNRLKLFERNLCSILKISKGCVELLPYSITSDIFPLSTDRDVHNYQAECRSDKGDNTSRFSLDTVLTISDILEVYEKVRSVSPNWFNLGLALKLSYTDLTNFHETYSGDNDVCLREALARRLQSGDPLTLGGMCTALKNSMVARNDVAEAIEGSLERVSERLERAQNSTTKTASVSSIESLDGAISEVVSIPRELEVDSMEMETLFNKLVSQLCQSLEVRRIDKDSLVACLMGFNCLNKVFGKTNQCVFRNQRNKLRKCSTSAGVWQIIADYFSFFDYEMVDHITDSFGTAEDKEKMKLYKANFVEYVKRRVRVTSSDSREDIVTMIVQLDSTYDDCELNRLKLFEWNVSSILNLNDHVLKLSKISKGCVELLPSSITSDIFPLSTDRDVHNYQAECRSDKGDNTSRSSLGSLTLGEVRAVMWGARYVWRKLGITLGLPHGTIQVIDKDHRTITDCFTAMLREWLMISPNPTWFELVEALRSPTVHLNVLADEIEDKYIKSDVSSVQEKEDTARSSTLQRARMEAALWGARARAKWFELGLALDLSEETLKAIHKNHTVLADRFTAMLGEWFQSSPNPTWSELVKALRSPTINRPDIAAEIEDKLIKSDDSSLQENKDTAGSLTLREVRTALWSARAKWMSLGLVLGLPVGTLEAIQEANLTNMPGDCFTELLAEWLKSSPNPTWSQLVEALRSPIIDYPGIADEIEDKYIKSDDSSVQESKDTASSASVEEQLKYLHKLNELLTDTENTINIRYLKLYLIGLSGLGKTTFRKRLLGHLLNLASIPPQDRKRCSTLLAECNQVLAVSSDSKLFLKASTDIDNEAQLIFAYMIGLQQVVKAAISKVVESADPTNDPIVDAIDASIDDSKPKEDYDTHPTVEVDPSKKQGNKEAKSKAPETNVDTNEDSKAQPSTKQVPQEGSKPAKPKAPETKVDKIIENLRNIVKRGNYMEQLVGTVLLNIIDIGGQPGFMEMLPFLSKGPGMFLAFFPLDKDLDELYEVSYEHDQDKITPFQAKYTIRETLSQILSAISHHVTVDSDLDSKIAEKVEHFADLQAVVSLVGTYQDVLEIQAKSEVVQEKLKGDYPGLDANTLEAAIQLILEVQQEVESEQKVEEIFFEFEAEVGKQDSFSNNLVEHVEQKAKAKATTDKQQKPTTPQEDTELQSKVEVLEKTLPPEIKNKLKQNTPKAVQLLLQMKQCNETLSKLASAVDKLSTDSTIQAETKKRLQAKLQEKHKVLSTITSNFGEVISHPDDSHFFSVDNFRGEEADIDPIRKHLQTVFDSRFDDAEIQIRPAQLLYGIILRKEFEIATMEECIQIGKQLEMDEDEVKFTIWYLHQCVGALLYYPDIKDKESYFKNHVICSPNVVFNSISLLIVESLLSLHSGDKRSRFTAAEIKKWQEFGQFSIPVIKLCCSKTNKAKVKEGELIPVDKLVKLLEHVSLLAPIVGKGPQPVYFMPAILECASKEELSNAPAIDSNTPSPIKITFESGYMPIGVFCAMISKLVSEGQNKILGLKWNLRESRVMRNLVSFEVDSAKHDITLVAHVNCYEIRLTRREDCNMHDLCSYVLTTVLYMMSGISKKIEPIIAFDCQCPKHQKAEEVCLCKLKNFFRCEHGRVDSLPPHQECWFAKEVKLDEKAVLEALRFADPDDLSFKWTRKGRKVASGSDNELTVNKVTRDHCDGFYTCEVSKNKQLCFKVHHCLRCISEATATGDDITLKTVKDATWDARAKWDHLAINLDVDEGTIKSIERSHNGRVDECFVAMLEAWFKKGSPSWSVMVEALRAPSVDRRGLANNIEKKFMNNSE